MADEVHLVDEKVTITEVDTSVSLRDRLALRPAEAAAVLGLSERAFRSALPRIPHVRVGTAVLVPVDALRRWLNEEARRQPSRVEQIVNEGLKAVRPANSNNS
jgi:hypothetical protein